jgi:uncharacterized membrane protein
MIIQYIVIFVVFSFIGGIIDTAYTSYMERRFKMMSFLGLCFSAIYGFGAVVLIELTRMLHGIDLVYRLIAYAVSLTLLEYIGALFCEKVLKVKLWDYSDLPFNFQGRISLQHSIYWVLLSVVFEYLYWKAIDPIMNITFMPPEYEIIIFTLFVMVMLSLTLLKTEKLTRKIFKLNNPFKIMK